MSDSQWLRARAVVERWFWVLVVVLAVVAVGSGWLAASAYAFPASTTEEHVVSTWSTQGSFTHQATVRSENPVFGVGTTLADRQVYYQSISPVADGIYTFTYESTGSGAATVETDLALQIRSVGENGEQVYWETTRPLASKRVEEVAPGTPVRTEFSLNTSAVENRVQEIESSLGGSAGSIEVNILAQYSVDGQIAGEQVDEQATYSIPLSLSSGTYSFGDPGKLGQRYERTEQVQVPKSHGPIREIVAPALAMLSFIGLAFLGLVRYRSLLSLDERERKELALRRHRSEYDEWISTATLPERVYATDAASVDSLEDLVDLAIDTDERVIEDLNRNRYVVRHRDVLYVYAPPTDIQSIE